MWKLVALVIVAFLFFCAVIYFYNRSRSECLAYEFNGKVENVNYDDKGKPTVLIDGKEYDLLVNFWNFNHKIQKGDSLIKQKNTMVIKLVKQETGDVIFFK
jgi:hypothetical protein